MCSKKKSVMISTIKPYGPPVSLIMGGVSHGIEPVFNGYYYRRTLINPKENED